MRTAFCSTVWLLLLTVAPVVMLCPAVRAIPPVNAGDATLDKRVAAYLSAYARHNRFNGAVLVARDGKILVRRAYGLAEAQAHVPNTPSTRFRIFSMSKAFTAAALLLLQEDGKLDLDAPVSRYLKDWPLPWADVTVRHLLQHTSGIPSGAAFAWWADHQVPPFTHPEIADALRAGRAAAPVRVTPGVAWEYSNPGYVIAAEIVKSISGKSCPDFLQERVFAPLGMTRTTAYQGEGDEHRARGYLPGGSVAQGAEQSTDYLVGAGDVVSTVDDLFKWDQALYTNQLLNQGSREALFTPAVYRGSDKTQAGYGLGWFVAREAHTRIISHTGGGAGFTSLIEHFPEEKLTVIVLSNCHPLPNGFFPEAIVGLARGIPQATPTFTHVPAGLRRRLAGRYRTLYKLQGKHAEFNIVEGASEDELILVAWGGQKVSLLANTTTVYRFGELTIRFTVPKQGPVQMTLQVGNKTVQLRRLP